ncbi:hypothetical protein PYW07_015995 [Mythimna separata]|uniref:MGA conserved domain-containing protein n=1 Tax=Mythimna separata TaxID=271217 RepID=A0AAD8DUW2_MYTSE|nr:hypothetical protein PYW07_015995 [Mythimna separata]
MEDNAKVFSSNITRVGSNHKNNLYDLLNIVPATPLKIKEKTNLTCDFAPKTGKYYIPKKKSRLKVKTVRDIRKSFEQDIYNYLTTDLEAQQNVLFKKIRRGSSRDDNTKKLATKILRGETPISRATWQMLVNLNPEQQKYPCQFVLWNGKLIQVNGSYGGVKKKICNYDLASKPQCLPSQNNMKQGLKQHEKNKNKRLLRNSLAVTFKPGPLCKKQLLDNSHQKYHVGKIELINLPKPGLDVQPKYGTAFDSSVTQFLSNFHEEDGTISQKWAELSVSVLGTIVKSKAVQLNKDYVTFELAYKYNQNRLLMRRDVDHCSNTPEQIDTSTLFTNPPSVDIDEEQYVKPEIKEIVNKILAAVEINLIQDNVFTQEQELITFPCEDLNSVNTQTHAKDKAKRRFGELDRLDVTVITLPETEEGSVMRNCSKMHCSLGCICESLERTNNLEEHCGRVECMFDCKCDFLKYKNDTSYIGCDNEFPGLLSIDNQTNYNLAKEEQKFHQTVIVSGEKRILLKGEKRNWKTSKKYADFYSNMSLKHGNQKTQHLSIVALKLNCENIEPWCMVHKLYKCFCKGKFTDTCASVSHETGDKEPKDNIIDVDCLENSKETNDINDIEDCERRERSVKKSKTTVNSSVKLTKVYTSTNMDKTTNSNKIIENLTYSAPEEEIQHNRNLINDAGPVLQDSSVSEIIDTNAETGMLTRRSIRKLKKHNELYSDNKLEIISGSDDSDYLDLWDCKSMSSSRTSAYEGRKYSNGYYKNTNDKISNMEKNDKRLRERLYFLYNKCCVENNTPHKIITPSTTISPPKTISPPTTITPPRNPKPDPNHLLKFLFDSHNGNDQKPPSKRRRLDNNTSLVTWLETHYKLFRQQKDNGLFKSSLEPPKHGKVALYTWNFISKRYRERKNLFLVSRKPPFRIFMAVTKANPFFENCVDINHIRFAEIQQYPETVRNLLSSNDTDSKDNFCILRGLSFCWELIGSVSKVVDSSGHPGQSGTPGIYMDMETLSVFNQNNPVANKSGIDNTEQKDTSTLEVFDQGDSDTNNLFFENTEHTETLKVYDHDVEIRDSLLEKRKQYNTTETSLLESMEQKDIQICTEKEVESNAGCSDDAGSSKWFVMTIENDFSEIRFFRKGFFVKYGSIINAISVARLSGKTVRLSSKKCIEQPEAPQFGIYAIPNDNEYCVFVGPYEMEDTLGIETIKTILEVRRLKRTRGFWITTNKVDNLKVVENPLSFVPLTNNRINSALIPLETNFSVNDGINNDQQEKFETQETIHINKTEESKECSPSKIGQIKIVKPIKIRKTNGFYHLASDGVLKKISLQYPQNATKTMPVILKPCINMEDNHAKSLLKPVTNSNLNPPPETSQEAFAESSSSAASQIKISAVFSTQINDQTAKSTSHERGMFILKPEEINRKLVQNKMTEMISTSQNEYNINDETITLSSSQSDLENVNTEEHHSVDSEWSSPNDDIYVISDDENNCKTSDTTVNCNIWSDVWIECTNIPKLGWIAGIRNLDNLISFKIPGCEYSEFYPEEEAFTNINLELRKRINNFDKIEIQWKVHESMDQLRGQEIDPDQLDPDYILTPEGLIHSSEIKKNNRNNLKTYSKKQLKGRGTRSLCEIGKVGDEKDKSEIVNEEQEVVK